MPTLDTIDARPGKDQNRGTFRNLGVVIRVNRWGLGFIEECVSRRRFVFTFEKIEGYTGETLRELALRAGDRIEFIASADEIECIYLFKIPRSQEKMAR